jgi:hypothetical protein
MVAITWPAGLLLVDEFSLLIAGLSPMNLFLGGE